MKWNGNRLKVQITVAVPGSSGDQALASNYGFEAGVTSYQIRAGVGIFPRSFDSPALMSLHYISLASTIASLG
jgi:hypothetical protein